MAQKKKAKSSLSIRKGFIELVREIVNRYRPWLVVVGALSIILIEPIALLSWPYERKVAAGAFLAVIAFFLTLATGSFPKSSEQERQEIKEQFEKDYQRKIKDYRERQAEAIERFGHYNRHSALAIRDLEVAIRFCKQKPDGWANKAERKLIDCQKLTLQLLARGMANILSVKEGDINANLMIPAVKNKEMCLIIAEYGGGDGKARPLERDDQPIPLEEEIYGAPKAFLTGEVQTIPDISREPYRRYFKRYLNSGSKFRSVLSMPLFTDGDVTNVIAVLNLDSPEIEVFSDSTKIEQFAALGAPWCYILSVTVTLDAFVQKNS